MFVSQFQATMDCCLHHVQTVNRDWLPGDPDWAKQWLDNCEKTGWVTPDEADQIRLACGWLVTSPPRQLSLFSGVYYA